jgi:arylamine N-acetyltransferase
VPYETIDIHLGRPAAIDPEECAARVVATGRAGYCFHLNGAFAALLEALGYDVRRHRAGVQGSPDRPAAIDANHLALTVHGLPTAASPTGAWLVDVGLGDGFLLPPPLRAGPVPDDVLALTLRPSAVAVGAWRLDHDPRGAFHGVDIASQPTTTAAFAAQHARLSGDPASGFVRVLSVLRRDASGSDSIQGLVFRQVRADGVRERVIETAAEWFGTIEAVFGLPLPEVTASDRRALWERVQDAHRERAIRRV